MKNFVTQKPRTRTEKLLVERMDGETLVYDLEHHRAHCLNASAALVWHHCDGRTTVSEMAVLVGRKLDMPANEDVVWMALDRLGRAHLLEERVTLPAPRSCFSRREVVRALGGAAGLTLILPALDSVVAPLAAQAASCLTSAQCRSQSPPSCTGLPICRRRNRCCIQRRRRRRVVCAPGTCP